MKLAIVATHPIQYYAPWFRYSTDHTDLELCVFYLWEGPKVDPDFQQKFEWDVPLTDGYDYEFILNTSNDPGTHHYKGLQNPELISTVSNWKPDALLLMAYNYESIVSLITRWKSIPKIFRGDSHNLGRDKKESTVKRFAKRGLYGSLQAILYVGEANKQMYQSFGVKEKKLFFSPHAIDSERFEKSKSNKDFRSELGIEDEEFVFLFVGKLIEKKQPKLLLDAFLNLESENTHLVFCGTGPLENELKSRAKESKKIHFLGFQNQSMMPSVYHLGDVIVLPSKGNRETWGLCINEAFSCNRPAIVSNHVGCYLDLIDQGRTGWTFDANSLDDLMLAMKECLKNQNQLNQMGNAANKLIQDYSYKKATQGLLEALDSLS